MWQLEVCFPILFYSTIAIAVGSTYYHWNPNDSTLVWDRLPMTLAFVSIFCFMLEEYIPQILMVSVKFYLPLCYCVAYFQFCIGDGQMSRVGLRQENWDMALNMC